jgi:putative tricarboxylic transport membrane protein
MEGFAELLQPAVLIPWILGMVFGVFVGATPGLTATMAVALIVPLSYRLDDPVAGLAMIIGVSFTAIFAGDIPATHLRIPGTPASAAATLDGHELAKQGRAEHALRLDLICSAFGGLVGVLALMLVAPELAKFALKFSSHEYFWLGVCGLCISAAVSQTGAVKGATAFGLGMLLSTVGVDDQGAVRFTFGQLDLYDGVQLIPAMIGLFGLSEVLRYARRVTEPEGGQPERKRKRDGDSPRSALRTVWAHKWTAFKSAALGALIGALPGAGADIAAWGAYGMAQRTSKNGRRFGTGEEEGVIAPTSANNAAVGGAWIPALVFGVPGDAVTAIVLGAFVVYEIVPGPQIFERSGDQVTAIFQIALVTQFLLLAAGYLGIKAFGWILRMPRGIVMVAVMVFSVVGSYAMRDNVFDVWIMLAFGVLGYFLESRRVPLAPLILGLILGPMIEENLRNGLIKEGGSLAPFFTRPICLVLILILAGAVGLKPLWSRVTRGRDGA